MKILLLGEFSGLHNNLKEGLFELGHDAFLISRNDGFKKIPSDYCLESEFGGFLGRIDSAYFKPFNLFKFLNKADVVQLVNPFYFQRRFFPNMLYLDVIRFLSEKFFFLAAGDDAYYWRIGKEKLKYGPFEDILNYDLKTLSHEYETDRAFSFNKHILEKSNGVIPVLYDFEVGYSDNSKRLETIPLPINTSKIKYQDNIVDGRLCVFHGLNRYGFKGTRHVEKAFNYLKDKYPNDLELIIDGHMPLDKYLEMMKRAHVVVDQTSSYSLGMNALYAMAMGKVVLGGAEPESFSSLGINSSPVLNIQPNSDSIINAIEFILSERRNIEKRGFESRLYVESHHDYVKIAQRYISVWASN